MIVKLNIFATRFIALTMLYCLCNTACYAQKMKPYFNKEYVAKAAIMCEESTGDNSCIGSELFLSLNFRRTKVNVSELEIDSCGNESITKIGAYKWKLLPNNEIKIDFIPEQIKNTFAAHLFLELKEKQLIGHIKHLNGKIVVHTFHEKLNN